MGAKHDHALMRVRYRNAVTEDWGPWAFKVMNQRAFLYSTAKAGTQTQFFSEWEIVCDDQPKNILLTMLELTKKEQEK